MGPRNQALSSFTQISIPKASTAKQELGHEWGWNGSCPHQEDLLSDLGHGQPILFQRAGSKLSDSDPFLLW